MSDEVTFEEALAQVEKHCPDRYIDFLLSYLSNGRNGARAAREAGFEEHSARQTAWRVRTNEYVKAAIEAFNRERLWSAAEIQERLQDLADCTIAPFLSDNVEEGFAVDFALPGASDHLHWIKGIEVHQVVREHINDEGVEVSETERRVKLRIHDRMTALDKLARIRGMYQDRLELEVHDEETEEERAERAGRIGSLRAAQERLRARKGEGDA